MGSVCGQLWTKTMVLAIFPLSVGVTYSVMYCDAGLLLCHCKTTITLSS